jgi:hypothetical protein
VGGNGSSGSLSAKLQVLYGTNIVGNLIISPPFSAHGIFLENCPELNWFDGLSSLKSDFVSFLASSSYSVLM